MGRTAAAVGLGLCCLLAVPGCGKDPSTPGYWEGQLDGAKRPPEKVRVLDSLRGSGKLTAAFLPMLHGHLQQEKNPEVKGALARTLGDLHDSSSVGPLSEALDPTATDGATSRMNSAIAQALGATGDARAVPALTQLLKSRDDYVRLDAIQALGILKAKISVPVLGDLALNDASSVAVNRQAVVALGNIADPRSVPVLLKALYKVRGSASFSPEAGYALFQIGRPAGLGLVQVLKGEDPVVAAWTRKNDVADFVVLVRAAEVLGDFALPEAERPLIAKLSYNATAPEQRLYVRMAAAGALGKMRSQEALRPISALLEDTEPGPRAEFSRALVLIGSREALPALLRAAIHGSWEARQFPVWATGMLGDARERPAFDKWMSDEAKAVAADCREAGCNVDPAEITRAHQKAIAAFGEPLAAASECKSDPACWKGKLGEGSAPVRQRAALELGRTGRAEMVPALAARITDKEADSRMAVLQGLLWLVQARPEAARALKSSTPQMEQQLAQDRGRQDYIASSDLMKRLLVEARRRGG